MSTPTFNSIAAVLETDFHLDRNLLKPDAVLKNLGLDAPAMVDVVSALEDAFHHRVYNELRDSDICGITLQRLCEVFDDITDPPAANGFFRPSGAQASSAATAAHSPSR
ncbi:acyl carrier protein [Variovorax humicola]|uniref:Acyl carrier protein n=1 Tax=Variovorax humicola TaxID=1769758 RepID=A0ABU8VW21_9BURK